MYLTGSEDEDEDYEHVISSFIKPRTQGDFDNSLLRMRWALVFASQVNPVLVLGKEIPPKVSLRLTCTALNTVGQLSRDTGICLQAIVKSHGITVPLA